MIKKNTDNPNAGEDVEILTPACITGENTEWYWHSGNQPAFKELSIHLPYEPEILILAICPREMKTVSMWKLCTSPSNRNNAGAQRGLHIYWLDN